MKRYICLDLFEEHPNVNLYTIRFLEDEKSLFDRFLEKHETPEFEAELQMITHWLDKIGQFGALERFFRPEGHPMVKAIPLFSSYAGLRLYCFRLSDSILILGGGKQKMVKKFQEDSELQFHVEVVKKSGLQLLKAIDQGRIRKARYLYGNLTFKIEL